MFPNFIIIHWEKTESEVFSLKGGGIRERNKEVILESRILITEVDINDQDTEVDIREQETEVDIRNQDREVDIREQDTEVDIRERRQS